MTNPTVTLHDVSFVLPDGRPLFADLNETLDATRTGLMGRNGVGKSVLARILAGLQPPTTGHCARSGPVHYLAQRVTPPPGSTVADLAGVAESLAALARIEAGGVAGDDFERVGDRWDLRERLQAALRRAGLPRLLLLDEPGNHLDLPSLNALETLLRAYRGALVVVSHDEAFLARLDLTDKLAATDQGWSLTPWRPLERARS